MPKYQVETDQGKFMVELDKAPSDLGQLRGVLQKHLSGDSPEKLTADMQQFDQKVLAPEQKRQQAEFARLASQQDVGLKTSSTGFAPAQPQSPIQVMETLNAPIDYVGDVAGRAVQGLIDPVKNPTLSDIGGGLTKAAIQYFGPQGISTAGRLAAKAAVAFAPGSQGGKIESMIGKTQGKLEGLKQTAEKSQAGFQRAVDKIPEGTNNPLSNTASTLDRLIASEEAAGIKDTTFMTDAQRISDKIKSGSKDLRWIDSELTRVGKKTKAVQGVDPHPGYQTIFASMVKDLESSKPVNLGQVQSSTPTFSKFGGQRTFERKVAPSTDTELKQIYKGGPLTAMPARGRTVQTQEVKIPETSIASFENPQLTDRIATPSGKGVVVRAKDEAARRTMGIDDVIDEFNNMVKTKRGQAGAQDINANQLMDKLKKNEFLTKSLRDEDWKEIQPLLTKLADTAALPAARGVSYGSGRALSRGAIAGGVASLTGMDPLTTAGAVTALDYATGHLLMTKSGRNMVKAVIESNAIEKSQKLNIINGMARLAEKGYNATQGGE